MVIECGYCGYSRACMTMFNEALLVIIVCIEHDPTIYWALYISSDIIRGGIKEYNIQYTNLKLISFQYSSTKGLTILKNIFF